MAGPHPLDDEGSFVLPLSLITGLPFPCRQTRKAQGKNRLLLPPRHSVCTDVRRNRHHHATDHQVLHYEDDYEYRRTGITARDTAYEHEFRPHATTKQPVMRRAVQCPPSNGAAGTASPSTDEATTILSSQGRARVDIEFLCSSLLPLSEHEKQYFRIRDSITNSA